jgi:hypothetical protein
MIKKIIFLFVIGAFLLSCSKEDNTDKKERGSVIEKKLLFTNNKSDFELFKKMLQLPDSVALIVDYELDLWKVKYNTIDPSGNPTIASGLLIVPKGARKPLPLLSYQHGTVLKKNDVPSTMQGGYQAGLFFAAEGYVVAEPDYLGLGDSPGLHPYVHAKSEATAIIDMMRASRKVCADLSVSLNDQVFITGYSQGGHATMAAQKMIEEQYSNEFKLAASAPMAGPYDLSGVQFDWVMRDTIFNTPGYLPYLIFAYNPIYKLFINPNEYFVSQYVTSISEFFNDNPNVDLDQVDKAMPQIPNRAFRAEVAADIKTNPNHPLRNALNDNNLYDWAPKIPLKMCHCDGDQTVVYQNSVIAYNSFKEKGATDVTLVNPLPGGNHSTCAIPSMLVALKWFRTFKK